MADGISVGSVSVEIVPTTRNFRRDLDAKLRDLSVDVRANLDDRLFKGELDAATRDRTVGVRVDDRGTVNDLQKRSSSLLSTLTLLAPATAPLTAVAVGGAAALGGLGAAGVLAVKGIQAEMAAGTPVGQQYTGMVATLKGDLSSLEKTAADGVLDGFAQSASLADKALPGLRAEVGLLSRSLGSDLAPVTAGVLGLVNDLSPSVNTLTGGVHSLAIDFEQWATGPGGRDFAAYLAKELPVVAKTLESLGLAGQHVVAALLPLGGPVLEGIEGMSTAISKIPVPVIEGLFGAFAAYKTVTLAAAALEKFGAGLDAVTLKSAATSTALKGLSAEEIAASRAGSLGKAGAVSAVGDAAGPLAVLGLIDTAVVGFLGQKVAGDTNRETKGLVGNPQALTAARQQLAALQNQQGNLKGGNLGRAGGNDLAAVTNRIKVLQSEITAATTANTALGLSANGTRTALIAEAAAAQKWATANDAAITTATNLVNANISLHQASADATAALKANGKGLDLNTQKGRDNQTALLNLAAAQHAKIDADIAAHKSQGTIDEDFDTSANKLYTMARRFGDSSTAAQNYVNKLLGIPRNILTTVTVGGIVSSEARIAELIKKEGAAQFYAGQKGHAAGGLITGPGTSTSDSVLTPLSTGEFVIKAATVKSLGVPFLQQLNQWHPGTSGPPAHPSAGHSGVTVNQTINAAPGMSEQAVAQIVGSQLAIKLGR